MEPMDDDLVRTWLRITAPLAAYHRHAAVGVEHIPREGPVLLLVHHTFATYDGMLLARAIYAETGRRPTALGDDRIFQIPGVADFFHRSGVRPASPTAGEELLSEGHLLFVMPGGMRESLRPRTHRYQVDWRGRRGFAKLALRTGAPIVLAACRRADEIFTLYPNRLTSLAYEKLHLPVPVARGVGPTFVPRPVKLRHHLSEPIVPEPLDEARFDEQVDALRDRCLVEMERLLSLE